MNKWLLKPFSLQNIPLFGCFPLNLLQYLVTHLRSLSLAKSSNVPLDWSHAYLLHWQRFLNQPYLVICALNPWPNKLSRLIRPKVDIHRNGSSILHLSHDLEIRRVIYQELSQANVLVQRMKQSNYRKLYIQLWLWPELNAYSYICSLK